MRVLCGPSKGWDCIVLGTEHPFTTAMKEMQMHSAMFEEYGLQLTGNFSTVGFHWKMVIHGNQSFSCERGGFDKSGVNKYKCGEEIAP